MASVHELAMLSAMAYDSSRNRFRGWYRKGRYGVRSGRGFYAESYKNRLKREVVLAIRGTDFEDQDWGDFYADIQIGLGKAPYQLEDAEKAFLEVKGSVGSGYQLFLTGHSLGGGVATLLAAQQKEGPPVVTFNSPGMLKTFVDSRCVDVDGECDPQDYCDVSKFLHIRASGDLVSKATGSHLGRVEVVYVDAWGDGKVIGTSRHLAQHSIDNMVACLTSEPWSHQDLQFGPLTLTQEMMARSEAAALSEAPATSDKPLSTP